MLKPGQVRWCLTWFGLKAESFAADAVELMGVNPQVVGGTCDQIRHRNGGLLFHRYGFHRLVALKTQETGQSHWRGVWPRVSNGGCEGFRRASGKRIKTANNAALTRRAYSRPSE